MRNLLLLLILANILYFVWGFLTEEPPEVGIAIVDESQLGPPLEVSSIAVTGSATSVGAVLGSGKASDLAAVVGRSCVTIGPFKTNAEADGAFADYDGQGIRASVRTTQGQVFVGHWVQIRKIPDIETGNGMLRTLGTGGLGDAYMVEDEDGGFKISLGLFGERMDYHILLAMLETGAHMEYLYERGKLAVTNIDEVEKEFNPVLKYEVV